MSVVLTAPAPPPHHETFAPLVGLVFRWVGANGKVWNLTTGQDGVVLQRGAIGFGRPEWDHTLQRSPAQHGSLWRGARANPRRVLLPLLVYTEEGEQGWLEVNREFWKSMRADQPGRLECEHPDGEVRSLAVRFVADGEQALSHDPEIGGWDGYVVEMLAEQPFWTGRPISRVFRNGSEEDFFAPADDVVNISEMDTATGAHIPNPGDHPAYLRWEVDGPMDELLVGVNGRLIHVDFPVPEGSRLEIDTRPTVQAAWLDGELVTRQLGAQTRFGPAPTGAESSLQVSFLGAGSVTASLTPLYDSAY